MAGARMARAASVIAALTVASRIAGFGRILVFTWAVGLARLGDLYQAANAIPNIIFEIVAGGALASLVVPVLAGPLRTGDRRTVEKTVSAQLTWVVTLLTPVAVVLALAAGPIVALMVPAPPAEIEVGATMLRIFAPQLPLYGIGVVLAGVLQAHQRFVWPVLAPLLSSVTVALAYAAFALRAGTGPAATAIDGTDLALLAGGTTLAVGVLTLCLVIPVRRLGLRIRPTYRLGEMAGPVRRLAAAGAVTVGAQQASLAVVLVFAGRGPVGSSVAVFNLAMTVFLLPWAVLAVPIATATFPTLAAKEAAGDRDGFAVTTATALRATLLVTAAGAGLLVAVAPDAAITLASLDSDRRDPGPLAAGIAAFGPGVVGYGLFALLSRALYARHRPAAVAAATVVGWAAVAVSAVALAQALPDRDRVAALAAGHSIGLTVLGAALLVTARRRIGPAALAGAGRAALVGLGAAAAGTAVALATRTITVPDRAGVPPALLRGVLSAVLVVVVFTVVAYAADRRDVRPALARVRRMIKKE